MRLENADKGLGGDDLIRVLMHQGKEAAMKFLPFSLFDSEDPEDLWDWMERFETETGGQVLAIPHNGNLSNGLMFDDVTMAGETLSADYAMRRMRWEPVYEVTQMKGDGEAHPFLSAEDEFADFYRAMFDRQTKAENERAVFLEYAWDMGWCDPCAADPLSARELRQLGVFWLDQQGAGDVEALGHLRVHRRVVAHLFAGDPLQARAHPACRDDEQGQHDQREQGQPTRHGELRDSVAGSIRERACCV